MIRRTHRRGFTLIELLVVISIIGTLVALLLPAVQMAREAARANTCRNNQHNMSIALTSYVGSKRVYPGYRDSLQVAPPTSAGGYPTPYPVSWTVMLLPFMEQRALYDAWKTNPQSALTVSGILEFMMCPSDTTTQLTQLPSSYIVNTGQMDTNYNNISAASLALGAQTDWQTNGVFMSRWEYNTTAKTIVPLSQMPRCTDDTFQDGKSNTFVISESLDAKSWVDDVSVPYLTKNGFQTGPLAGNQTTTVLSGYVNTASNLNATTTVTPEIYLGFVWWPNDPGTAPTGSAPSVITSINGTNSSITGAVDSGFGTDMFYARPSSSHPGTVNMTYADGRTATVNEGIDYTIFCLLMTPDGKHCTPAGREFQAGLSTSQPYATYRTQIVTGADVQ